MQISKELEPTEKGFLFDPYTGYTYTLNTTGSFIFKKIKDGMDISEIAKEISDRYKMDQKRIVEDIRDFVEHIKNFGLDKK